MKTEQGETAEESVGDFVDNCAKDHFSIWRMGSLRSLFVERIESRDRAKLLEGMRAMKEAIAKNFEGRDRCTGDRECASNIREIDPAEVLAEMEAKR